MKTFALATAATLLAAPLLAQDAPTGDAAAGEEQFNRQCVTCHVVVNEAGETLAGRNARTGPNLYGMAGATIGAVADFRYSEALLALNAEGTTWDEDSFVAYVQDPTAWLREATGDSRARGLMSWRVREEQQARDIYAYLASLGE
ncbi:MAG: monoheme cytochrome c [Rhodobacteraceae bacterium HLUCCA08]|nr:MAG: monoheme cytochrome c [Rhodobacteraceae bacterium HLUCCA08]